MTELDPGARELLDLASEGDGPTSLQRSRVRAAVLGRVGVAVVVTSATSAAASTSATGAAASTFAGSVVAAAVKVVAAAAIVGAMGTGGYLLVTSEPGPRPAATMAPIVVPAPPEPPRSVARSIPSPVLEEAILPAPSPAPERPGQQQPSGAGPEAKPGDTPKLLGPRPPARAAATGATDTFAAETHALADAVAMLRDGHADRALDAFGAQDLQYAGGALGEERAAARIEALCVLGRTSEASAAAARFLEQHPRSLQAGRVRSSCGGSSGPSIP